ncbi:MAG TPA: TPM domain-containing protein [Treponemataceae bacterium]|nr:TPM domain-containing protein [Treponemataceae bacterium]
MRYLEKNSPKTKNFISRFLPLFYASFLLCFCLFPLAATPNIPNQTAWVMDSASIMSASEKASLEKYLINLDEKTSIQIAVFTVGSLNGYPIEDYSLAVAEKWQLGQKQKENGALLFVALDEHKLRIEVGYGLEERLTDATSGLIIRNIIAPYFRKGQMGQGVIAGVQTMAGTVVGDTAGLVDESLKSTISAQEDDIAATGFSVIILFVFFILMMLGFSRKNANSGKNTQTSDGKLVKTVIAANVLSNILSSSRRSRGGFGGGGFRGGGGGGFGGGGASGGW